MDISAKISTLNTAVSALQISIAGVSVASDTAGLATVMGPAVHSAGVQPPGTLQATVRDDPQLRQVLDATTLSDQEKSAIRKATRMLMVNYGIENALAVSKACAQYFDTQIALPTTTANAEASGHAKRVLVMVAEIQGLAARMVMSSANSNASKLIENTYLANIKFVTEYSAKLQYYNLQVVSTTSSIDTLMMSSDPKDATYAAALEGFQKARAAVGTERKYAELQIIEYFDCGGTQHKAGIKTYLTDLAIPANVSKGKGVELIKNIRAFLKGRAPWFYTIFPDTLRTLEESRIGNHHEPPTKKDGYSAVPVEFRDHYNLQAQELYDTLDGKVPKEIMANIRKPFKYGMSDKKACCEIGDGPMAIFCILALYRPSGETYRDEVKDKILGLPSKFTEGSNPAQKVHDNMAIIQVA
jgi:hypothetical protein